MLCEELANIYRQDGGSGNHSLLSSGTNVSSILIEDKKCCVLLLYRISSQYAALYRREAEAHIPTELVNTQWNDANNAARPCNKGHLAF
jgi:hypothetical protein